jgi:hypothetical protein
MPILPVNGLQSTVLSLFISARNILSPVPDFAIPAWQFPGPEKTRPSHLTGWTALCKTPNVCSMARSCGTMQPYYSLARLPKNSANPIISLPGAGSLCRSPDPKCTIRRIHTCSSIDVYNRPSTINNIIPSLEVPATATPFSAQRPQRHSSHFPPPDQTDSQFPHPSLRRLPHSTAP